MMILTLSHSLLQEQTKGVGKKNLCLLLFRTSPNYSVHKYLWGDTCADSQALKTDCSGRFEKLTLTRAVVIEERSFGTQCQAQHPARVVGCG